MTIDTKRLETDAAYWDEVAGTATHYCPSNRQFYDCRLHPCCIPRPTTPAAPEWDGEGYAEPGQKVSYNNGHYFEESEVLARKDCWLWLDVPSVGFVTVQQVAGLIQPLRTKGQREKQELEETLKRWCGCTIEVIAGVLIDNGWTKP